MSSHIYPRVRSEPTQWPGMWFRHHLCGARIHDHPNQGYLRKEISSLWITRRKKKPVDNYFLVAGFFVAREGVLAAVFLAAFFAGALVDGFAGTAFLAADLR